MIKHVGKHNNRKVVIIYREVPGEEHMCLLVYSDVLPRMIHDELMRTVEGGVAQSTPDLANVLFRTLMADGTGILQALHSNGLMKKVPTNQVIVTPNASSNIRLDELNKLLAEMAKGEEAVKKLANVDANRGFKGGAEPKEVGVPPNTRAGAVDVNEAAAGILSDADLAQQRLDQATSMKQQAEQLLAEAKRLEAEAKELTPKNVRSTKKAAPKKKQEA